MPRTLELCALIPLALAAVLLTACSSRSGAQTGRTVVRPEDNIAERIDRGDWMILT